MNKQQIIEQMFKQKLVVIIRVEQPEQIDGIVENLLTAGVGILEITSNTPGFASKITQLREQYPNLIVGAGTITTVEIAEQAKAAGAQFLVTPNTCKQVGAFANEHNLPVLMGAFTPTDVVEAKKAGADVVKLFPAEPIGPEYLKALAKGPFLDTAFFPVGGIDQDNFEQWIDAGAKGLGIGGALAKPVETEVEKQQLIAGVSKIVNRLKQMG
ncbi:bifunctional 4-hydroxy-2-oxoglutarate aldolase/2-dehydro-3-deoxy-phosphogluconate aldolase [Catenovulum sp. 2E275]|uniref:bifunctional 4-hydroxy-2-oxoglutarate aldolase/2-dehydro-3-deoxy-phosphogluconate aldolase n=1 Tax=Catenovulum sp. 2E275 TaxID=2980497 RepID=UPI0021CE41E0|nr:bifunctional 4-hydroxy-2-oxoglutarate aldolase/2-dehydro-3-deoxy-phosphogluconate aldolase [Catenovulum sp. 2E275]MCU4675623.1 bifunctional 4-hydroxy-2-oxoglutarate aldolase/2-dehydro-3-deoxy-phosphogluconate aldolase [Catenovulum sp. 2E275]